MKNIKQTILGALLLSPAALFAQVVHVESVQYPQATPPQQANTDINIPYKSCDRISSDDGRYVVFDSYASNLVAGDHNGHRDVFVRDIPAGITQRISVNADGTELDGDSYDGCISGDGRYVVYSSNANPANDREHEGRDVYLYDRLTNTQRNVSLPRVPCSPCGGAAVKPTIAADGSSVVFTANSAYLTAEAASDYQVYRYDIASGNVELISKSLDGTGASLGVDFFQGASTSATGRYIAFTSHSNDLVVGDTNGFRDVFVYDQVSNSISRVSLDENGNEVGTNDYETPRLSGSGSHVLFVSEDDLISIDSNNLPDVYVHRLSDGLLELASQASNGALGTQIQLNYYPSISHDGRKVAFTSNDGVFAGVAGTIAASQFVRDLSAGTTTRVVPDLSRVGDSFYSRLSGNGHTLLYTSTSAAEVAGDNNGVADLFRIKLATMSKILVSSGNSGVATDPVANAATVSYSMPQRGISDDGRYVLFNSGASNLDSQQTPIPYRGRTHLYLADRLTGENIMVDAPDVSLGVIDNDESSENASLSADGRYVVYHSSRNSLVAGDNNDKMDIFLWDRTTRSNRRLNVNAFGTETDDDSWDPAISADGRHVVFTSAASNLTTDLLGSTDNIFHIDLNTDVITLISKDSGGNAANDFSLSSAISADGRYVVFDSAATNLVANDNNNKQDVFLHDRQTGQTTRVSIASSGTEGDDDSNYPSISDDGHTILFASEADNLGDSTSDDTFDCDFFVHTPATGITEVVGKNSNGIELIGDRGSCSGHYARLSADGRYVMFTTNAANLIHPGDSIDDNLAADVFVRDRDTGITRRVSEDALGQQSLTYQTSSGIGISADGRYVSISSRSTNWQVSTGYRAISGRNHYVMELEGFAERTGSVVNPASLGGASAGSPHTVQVHVSGDNSRPVDGMMVIQADNGQSCRSNTLVNIGATTVSFSCDLTFTSPGDYQLQASYLLSANHAASTATASISVAGTNTAPVAYNQNISVDENSTVNITLTGSDADGDSLSYALVTQPAHGSLSGSAPNVTYTPDIDYFGNDSFTFKVNDGTVDSPLATVNITVSEETPAPTGVIFSDSFE